MSSVSSFRPRLTVQRQALAMAALLRRLGRMWHGAPELTPALRMEHRFVVNRYLSLILLVPAVPLLGLSTLKIASAYALLTAATIYNVTVHALLRRRSSWLDRGYLTTV